MWFAATVTGVALVTGGVFGTLALTTRSDFDDAPSARLADRGERYALVADVAFGVAVAAGLTTIFALASAPSDGGGAAPAVVVAPSVQRAGGGVQAIVEF